MTKQELMQFAIKARELRKATINTILGDATEADSQVFAPIIHSAWAEAVKEKLKKHFVEGLKSKENR